MAPLRSRRRIRTRHVPQEIGGFGPIPARTRGGHIFVFLVCALSSRFYHRLDVEGLAESTHRLVVAATSTVTTKINEIRHGSSFSAESPT